MSTSHSPNTELIERDRLKAQLSSTLEATKDLYASFELLRKHDLLGGAAQLCQPLLEALRKLFDLSAPLHPTIETLSSQNGEAAHRDGAPDPHTTKLIREASGYLEKMSAEDCATDASSGRFSEHAWSAIRLLSILIRKKSRSELWTPTDNARLRQRILRGFLVTALAVCVCVGARLGYRQWRFANLPPHTIQRIQDLKKLEAALVKYGKDNGHYPSTNSRWDGLHSSFGQSVADWIPGLVPKYIDALPRDPRNHTNGEEQYLYWSDGKTFKVIAHNTSDARMVQEFFPEMYDTARPGRSLGVWSTEAADK